MPRKPLPDHKRPSSRSYRPPLSGVVLAIKAGHIRDYMVHFRLDYLWERTPKFTEKVAKLMHENKFLTTKQAVNAVAEKHSP